MTRGKYASVAERRREMEALQRRAAHAETERDHLAGSLADITALRERETSALRAENAELRRQRDDRAAPRIAELETLNNRLRAERNEALADREYWQQSMCAGADRLAAVLAKHFRFGIREATELVDTAWFGIDAEERLVDSPATRAMQRARGRRKYDDLSAIVTDAPAHEGPRNRRVKESLVAAARRREVEREAAS